MTYVSCMSFFIRQYIRTDYYHHNSYNNEYSSVCCNYYDSSFHYDVCNNNNLLSAVMFKEHICYVQHFLLTNI